MLNFAEQTGSGAVMLVWSFPKLQVPLKYIITIYVKHTTLPWYRFYWITYKNSLVTYLRTLYGTLLYSIVLTAN
jgi:hypothetical protein